MKTMKLNNWLVQPEENRLQRRGEWVEIQPRCMDFLMFLAARPGQVVGREELHEHVWRGRIVGEDALNNCVKKLRQALGDDPRNPRMIQTVNGRGYRLLARVHKPLDLGFWLQPKRWLPLATAAALLAMVVAQADVTVYRFSTEDTPEQRQAKLEQMAGDIGPQSHSISIRVPHEAVEAEDADMSI
jgi:DNA-binding winged helix-turn-helix (wHTH) protein